VIEIVFESGFYTIGSVAVDAVLREVHHLAGEATTHPVESGSDISDHYRPAPRAVELEGVITDTPIGIPGSHASGAKLVQHTFEIPKELFGMRLGPIPISIAGPSQQGSVTTFSATMERVRATWEDFEAMFAERKVITVVTSLRTYDDMVLTELEVDRKPGSYRFHAFAQQITTVQSGRSRAAPVPAVKRAVPKVDKGNQQPKPVPTPQVDKDLMLQAGMGNLLGVGP
jgi:hypothetical protein